MGKLDRLLKQAKEMPQTSKTVLTYSDGSTKTMSGHDAMSAVIYQLANGYSDPYISATDCQEGSLIYALLSASEPNNAFSDYDFLPLESKD